MIVTYYPYSKNSHNLKVMEFEIFRNSKYVSKPQNFKCLLSHVNRVSSTWNIKQSCSLWYKKLKPKVSSIFL
jgi:hypothetical protein